MSSIRLNEQERGYSARMTDVGLDHRAPAGRGGPNDRRRDEGGRSRWALMRTRWPLAWGDLGLLVVISAVLTVVFVGLGELITGPLDGSVGRVDRDIAESLANGRSAALVDLSYLGSMLAETGVKIVVTTIASGVMLAVWKRWHDALLVAVALILEASVFLITTLLVGRPRPQLARLDASPVDSSFPSGHVAAAVVYGTVVLIVSRHTTKRWPVVLATLLVAAVTFVVGWSRMFRGMHFLSDVIGGVLLGLASIAATWWVLHRAERRVGGADRHHLGGRGVLGLPPDEPGRQRGER